MFVGRRQVSALDAERGLERDTGGSPQPWAGPGRAPHDRRQRGSAFMRQRAPDADMAISSPLLPRRRDDCNDPAESAQFKPLMHMPERVFSWQALDEGACGYRS
jgi:hypothetical protein